MKYIGIVRKLDDLGRITLPMELRRTTGIEDRAPLEIMVDGDVICLKKYVPGCTICGSTEQLMEVDGIKICRSCGVKVVDKFMEE